MESLAPEIEPFGLHTTVVNPGFFRTELLTTESTNYVPASIEDYAERDAAQREFWDSMNGQQIGDPAKLAQALLTITDEEEPPFRFIAGADALAQAEDKLAERQRQIDAYRALSSSLALDEAETVASARIGAPAASRSSPARARAIPSERRAGRAGCAVRPIFDITIFAAARASPLPDNHLNPLACDAAQRVPTGLWSTVGLTEATISRPGSTGTRQPRLPKGSACAQLQRVGQTAHHRG
jgi:hypothetical protein